MESEQYVSPVLGALSIGVVFAVLAAMLVLEAPWAGRVRGFFADHTQKAMFAVAMTATLSSLYYSEYVGFIPCEFCWFQRIAMYPLAALLLVALVSRARLEPRYILTLAGVGLPISIYHYQLQLFPEQKGVCSGIISCTDRNVTEFGIVSIPFMAAPASSPSCSCSSPSTACAPGATNPPTSPPSRPAPPPARPPAANAGPPAPPARARPALTAPPASRAHWPEGVWP